MISIKGHFDGNAIVLDEPPPLTLTVGQAVRVVIQEQLRNNPATPPRKSLAGFAKGMFEKSFAPHADPTAALRHAEPFDERDALRVDPLDAVPSDFVRRPGSGVGEIGMADDFDETPDEFKDYL